MSEKKTTRFGIKKEIVVTYALMSLIGLGGIAITTGIFLGIIASMNTGLEEQVRQSLEIQLTVIFVTMWEIVIISLFAGIKIANSVIRPIYKITQMAVQLATHDIKTVALQKIDTDFDRELETQDHEIVNLTLAFKNLVKAVKKEVIEETEKKEKT